jgi:hypothetical protein
MPDPLTLPRPSDHLSTPPAGVAVGSPEWLVDRLYRKIRDDVPTMELWWRYYVGDHPFPEAPEKVRRRLEESYNAILARANSNFMASVVDVVAERCRPIGFRLGSDSNFSADQDSWRIWQASKMDADAPLAIETALAKGRAFLSTWFHAGDDFPTIAAEDPGQCIVEFEPGSRHRRRAALKTYRDEWTGEDIGELYLPGDVDDRSRRLPGTVNKFVRDAVTPGGWKRMPGEEDPIPNPGDYHGVPIVPLIHRPRLMWHKLKVRKQLNWGGESRLADVTSIQDRMNETIVNRIIALWWSVFKQKWATGLVLDEEPVLGPDGKPELGPDGKPLMKPVEPWDVFQDRMLAVDDKDIKFGDFSATDIDQYLKPHERDLQDLSTIKRIPRHYLFQEGQSPSGDAIKSAETGLVAVVRRTHLDLGDPFEETNRIARIMAGGNEAAPDSEMVWDDPEFRTYGELVDGVLKEFQAGLVPWEGALEKLGYTPQQIARFRGQRDLDALLRAMETAEPGAEPEPDPV